MTTERQIQEAIDLGYEEVVAEIRGSHCRDCGGRSEPADLPCACCICTARRDAKRGPAC